MKIRLRPSLVALILVVVIAAAMAGLYFWRLSADATVADLMERLPDEDAPVLYLNVVALRNSGLLELLVGTGAGEESEYRDFVEQSSFDYRTDLDEVLASFPDSGDTFFVLKGRFNWKRLRDYVENRGGDCHNGLCRVSGSAPGRRISFFAVTPSIMALASSRDSWAVLALQRRYRELSPESVRQEPIWYSATGRSLSDAEWLPDGSRSFVSALAGAGRVTFAASPANDAFEARLIVDCKSIAGATKLAAELVGITELLASLIRREHKNPSPSDLSGILTRGKFDQRGTFVEGRWPVPRAYLESLVSGDL